MQKGQGANTCILQHVIRTLVSTVGGSHTYDLLETYVTKTMSLLINGVVNCK
nr:hypothetical protein [Tanacetum cinerariifolium]GFB65127.1 hypothetical protein [Tanacetum cinerariifolium]